MRSTAMVHVRIDEQLKTSAAETLGNMGLSISDAVRIFLKRVVVEKAIPFDVRIPNAETVAAIQELEAGNGARFSSVEALMDDLNADS